MEVSILVWTCVVVFVVTAGITLLGVLNIIKIKSEYLSKLFYFLIIEIVAAGVLVFKNTLTNKPDNIIRIVYPKKDSNLKRGESFFVGGFCQIPARTSLEGNVVIANKSYDLLNFKIDDRGVFTAYVSIIDSFPKTKGKIMVSVTSNGTLLTADSVVTTFSIQ